MEQDLKTRFEESVRWSFALNLLYVIYIGTGLNCLVISKLYQKANYKGLPATILPFLCILPLLLFLLRTPPTV